MIAALRECKHDLRAVVGAELAQYGDAPGVMARRGAHGDVPVELAGADHGDALAERRRGLRRRYRHECQERRQQRRENRLLSQ